MYNKKLASRGSIKAIVDEQKADKKSAYMLLRVMLPLGGGSAKRWKSLRKHRCLLLIKDTHSPSVILP